MRGRQVKDKQIVTVELCNRAFEGEVATSDLELLYEIGRACEQHVRVPGHRDH